MEPTKIQAKVRIPRGKFNGINAVADERGIIAAAAMDQRGSLRKAISKAKGSDATEAEVIEFKVLVTEVLTPYASAILLDPEYGLEAVKHRAKQAGVLLAYEKTGYDASIKGRLPDLLPEWSVRRLINAGANVIKILMYYDPDDTEQINTIKEAFIERVGAECRAYAVPFFLEVLAYSDEIGDESSLAFARVKPSKVKKYMREFSQPQYGADVLKVEIPVNMRYVEGSKANPDGQLPIVGTRPSSTSARRPLLRVCPSSTSAPVSETRSSSRVWSWLPKPIRPSLACCAGGRRGRMGSPYTGKVGPRHYGDG